jgi:hypothetical protein
MLGKTMQLAPNISRHDQIGSSPARKRLRRATTRSPASAAAARLDQQLQVLLAGALGNGELPLP